MLKQIQKFENDLVSKGYSFIKNDNVYNIQIPNGELIYSPFFFNDVISKQCMDYFLDNEEGINDNWRDYEKDKLSYIRFNNIKWSHDKVFLYDKEHYLPRYSAWYGNNNKPYTYSGLTLTPHIWNGWLEFISKELHYRFDINFNRVLLNWYRDGQDTIGWHKDAEPSLGKNPIIGSVNFGETRRFLLRRIDNNKEKLEIPLGNGTLLLMKGEIQHYWQHSVPKQAKVKGNRINLTFRIIK